MPVNVEELLNLVDPCKSRKKLAPTKYFHLLESVCDHRTTLDLRILKLKSLTIQLAIVVFDFINT